MIESLSHSVVAPDEFVLSLVETFGHQSGQYMQRKLAVASFALATAGGESS